MTDNGINIGVLFSQSGSMSVSENAHLEGVLLACDEINRNGGIEGEKINPIVFDPKGDNRLYAEMAIELLIKHQVNIIFGCCLSSSRKIVLPIVERYNGILFYPSVYEGFEYSPNVIYGGAVPNQLVIPLLKYLFKEYGRNIAFIGSDTIYAREINRIVKEFLDESGGDVVSEKYLAFNPDKSQLKSALNEIISKSPDVILSTVVGDDSVDLYNLYAKLKSPNNTAPIASLTTTESELLQINKNAREGHIAVGTYFSSLKTEASEKFVQLYKDRYGIDRNPGVYSEVGYSLVHFFADSVRLAGNVETDDVLANLTGAVFKAPSGGLFIDLETNHFTVKPLVAKSNKDGCYEIQWKGNAVVKPDPYLISYDRSILES